MLLAAFAWHPYIAGRLPNDSAIADAVADDPTRWGLAHLTAAVASGVVVLAFIAIAASSASVVTTHGALSGCR